MLEYFNISFFVGKFQQCWGNVLYVVLYIGCLFYISRSKKKVMNQVFVWPFVILLATIFNPFVMEPVLKLLGWRDRYVRFFWILPVEFLCAFFAAELIAKQKKGAGRNVLILFLICLLFLCGGSASEIKVDDNIYKIDDSVIAVADLIEAHKETENPVVFYDAGLYYWIRQYDPALIAAVSHATMDIYQFDAADEIDTAEQYESKKKALSMFARGVEIDVDLANELLEEQNVDYFVRNVNNYSDFYLAHLNLAYVDAAGDYELYRCTHD